MDDETLEFFKKTLGDGSQDYIQKQKADLEEDGLLNQILTKIEDVEFLQSIDRMGSDQEA